MKSAADKWNLAIDLKEMARDKVEKRIIEVLQDMDPIMEESTYHLFRAGGKRLRALIPCLVAGACGADPMKGLDVGVGLEFLHTASLIHDDIMDGSVERRGVEAVHTKFGNNTAINTGNLLVFLGMRCLAKAVMDNQHLTIEDVWGPVTECLVDMVTGQQLDIDVPLGHQMGVDYYMAIIRRKTAPLFTAGALLGAKAGGAEHTVVADMAAWGSEFGLSFQARDDVLDHYEGLRGDDNGESLQKVADEHRTSALEWLSTLPSSIYLEHLHRLTIAQTERKV